MDSGKKGWDIFVRLFGKEEDQTRPYHDLPSAGTWHMEATAVAESLKSQL